jgi:hypothetical protein
MSRYSVKVQLVKWFEIVVNAPSRDVAVTRAEALRPDQIKARGRRLHAETGLADPDSTREIES